MSLTDLEKVIPGPLVDGFDGEFIVVDRATAQTVATIHVGSMESRIATAQLFSLAYDHALLLRAVGLTVAQRHSYEVRVVCDNGWVRYAVTLDAFGIPALTPALRESLRAAVRRAS